MLKILLKQLLRERGITQAELAEHTKIRPSTICDLCNNNAQRINLKHLDSICMALDCGVADVIKIAKGDTRI